MMNVAARRQAVDLPDHRTGPPSREHEVSVEPAISRCDLREGHPHLKGNAAVLRQHDDRADRLDALAHQVEQRSNGGRPAAEVMLEIEGTAGVRLVPVGEGTVAVRALPERAGSTANACVPLPDSVPFTAVSNEGSHKNETYHLRI